MNITKPKRIIAINDIVSFGRASLANIIPVMSAMGHQVCPVPTAVLSAHTGGLGKPAVVSLTDELPQTLYHWKKLNLNFDCVFSGYLADAKQGVFVREFIEEYKKQGAFIAVDPAMADHGKLYSGISPQTIDVMKSLSFTADIIFPNLTEACQLSNTDYSENKTDDELKIILEKLCLYGTKMAVMTGIPSKSKNHISVMSYDRQNKKFIRYETPMLGGSYPGTGDIFAAVCTASLLLGKSLSESVCHSMNFISKCIEYTLNFNEPSNYGVMFEPNLKLLYDFTNNIKYEEI